jgi:hypothetical protein
MEDPVMTRTGATAFLRPAGMGLLAGIMVTVVWLGGRPHTIQAQAAPPPAGTSGTIAFTTAGPGTAQMLYLVDTRAQSVAIYRVDPNEVKGTLKLEAARQYGWDLKLGEFNNQPPEVAAVEAMVGSRR